MGLGEFYFLMAGMLDVTEPEKTDPIEELVRKRLKALMDAKRKNRPRSPRGRRR